eukprot:s1763_g8.t1
MWDGMEPHAAADSRPGLAQGAAHGFAPPPLLADKATGSGKYKLPPGAGRPERGSMTRPTMCKSTSLRWVSKFGKKKSILLEEEFEEPERSQAQRVEFVRSVGIRAATETMREQWKRETMARKWRMISMLFRHLGLSPKAETMEGACGRLLNQKEAIAVDEELMASPGFSVDQLMELAGLSVACAVATAFPRGEEYGANPAVLLVCGPGNNGGDGLVAARHLYHFGYAPHVIYPKANQKSQLFVNLTTQLAQLSVPVEAALPENLERYCVVVDAIFGFSFSGAVRAPFDEIIRRLSSGPPVLSVDIPSGWDVEQGPPAEGVTLQPGFLISLTAPKMCAAHFKGRHFLGGRFVPPGIVEKYQLKLPIYPGISQVVELPN